MKKSLQAIVLFSVTAAFLFLNTAGHAEEPQESTEAKTSSFFHQTLAGKYNLLEEDFDDVPHRATRYDYLKEEAEKMRLFSRPDGPEFAILNLQWKQGGIFVNNFETVSGQIRKRKWLSGDSGGGFFYRLFSDRRQLLHEGRLEITPALHFDFVDEETGELTGGAVNRNEFDFTLKIPLPDKSAQKIIFYRRTGMDGIKKRLSSDAFDRPPADTEQDSVLGETQF